MQGAIIEWAPFRTKEGVTEEELLEASAALQTDFLERQEGFLRRELLRGANDHWCDLVYWRDDAAAKQAMEEAMKSTVCARYFALMSGVDQEDPGAGLLHFAVRQSYGMAAAT